MNLPNKLTIFRVILIPFFIVFLLVPDMPFLPSTEWGEWIALAIFVIASLTDMLDGKIARKYNLITDFGKFMDPLADKLLVCSALIALIELGRIPAWMVIVIIARISLAMNAHSYILIGSISTLKIITQILILEIGRQD